MSQFDIVGYNYQINRYEADHNRIPTRIMLGTESYTRDLFVSWQYTTKLPYVVGDFVWTGIDYLGESGIGRSYAPSEKVIFHAIPQQFPYHGAYCGDIDLTGFRKPISHDRNIVWDRGENLFTSITEPTPSGKMQGGRSLGRRPQPRKLDLARLRKQTPRSPSLLPLRRCKALPQRQSDRRKTHHPGSKVQRPLPTPLHPRHPKNRRRAERQRSRNQSPPHRRPRRLPPPNRRPHPNHRRQSGPLLHHHRSPR